MAPRQKDKLPEEVKLPVGESNQTGASVSIPEASLKAVLQRLEDVEATNKLLMKRDADKDKQIDMLRSVSDKARLARMEEQDKGVIIRTASVSFWEGEPVLAWTKVKDEVGFRDGRLVVNQQIRLFLDKMDEETKQLKTVDLDYLYWVQNISSQQGEVVEKSSNTSGDFWTIQMKDGRRIKVDIRFINAF